mmetsp:Transcript_25078/g.73440  ORF Transcript_25078/g.73440 Transcript_25078/m.73440 type:complete len:96 (+) Transcript_25078:2073-2360(+)
MTFVISSAHMKGKCFGMPQWLCKIIVDCTQGYSYANCFCDSNFKQSTGRHQASIDDLSLSSSKQTTWTRKRQWCSQILGQMGEEAKAAVPIQRMP